MIHRRFGLTVSAGKTSQTPTEMNAPIAKVRSSAFLRESGQAHRKTIRSRIAKVHADVAQHLLKRCLRCNWVLAPSLLLKTAMVLVRCKSLKEARMIELTPQEQQAVDACAEPRLIDPRNQKAYVLVEAGVIGSLREPPRTCC
jgi:hypothetical protein